jgi:uncharacterized protein YdeI (BOF family)
MKKLILAAGLTLIALPAFAADAQSQQTAMAANAQQKHSYAYSSEEGTGSATEVRNARLHREALERSDNAKAAVAGSVHYY